MIVPVFNCFIYTPRQTPAVFVNIVVTQWKTQSLTGFSTNEQQTSLNRKQQQADQKQIKQLKQEIKRKDKALAEAAAILILRKKLNALWGEDEDE
jgi:transposase